MRQAKVGVVILNWNGLEDLLECLKTVVVSSYKDITTIVVDNGSADDTLIVLPAAYPGVILIATGKNLGWAGGNNVGIQRALEIGCDYVFLLNNDTTIDFNCIEKLVRAANTCEPSLVHPSVYYYDTPEIAQLDPLTEQPDADRSALVEINYAYGAALLVHANVFQQVGLIDDRFFLQMEEADFYYRAKRLDIKSYVLPDARVLHKESRSFGGKVTPVKCYYITRNSVLLLYKHAAVMGGWRAGLKRFYWTLSHMIDKERGDQNGSFVANVCWVFSRNATAKAIQFGLRDALFRKYGPLDASRLSVINDLKKS
jgi:GT2 family glycosyltransferase